MTEYVPKVGERVRLSRRGLQTVRGLRSPEEIDAHLKGSIVVNVEPVDTIPPCYAVDLDGPLGMFLITHLDVEPFR